MIEAVRVSFCPGIIVNSSVPFEHTKFAFGVQTLNVTSSSSKSLPQPSAAKFNNFKVTLLADFELNITAIFSHLPSSSGI